MVQQNGTSAMAFCQLVDDKLFNFMTWINVFGKAKTRQIQMFTHPNWNCITKVGFNVRANPSYLFCSNKSRFSARLKLNHLNLEA